MATYIILNIVFIALLLTVAIRFRTRFDRSWLIALLVLLAMTAVFDNLIILAGIVLYDPSKNLHLFIGVAPIEDFFYPLAALLILPALWHNKETHAK